MVDRVVHTFSLDYQPEDEVKAHELELAKNETGWFEKNRAVGSDQVWAEMLGQKSAHYLARSFQDGHHAELARVAFTSLMPYLLEVEKRPELGPSFLHGVFREFRYLGLPHPENISRKFS